MDVLHCCMQVGLPTYLLPWCFQAFPQPFARISTTLREGGVSKARELMNWLSYFAMEVCEALATIRCPLLVTCGNGVDDTEPCHLLESNHRLVVHQDPQAAAGKGK
jgi:hypothetical protein